MILDARAFFKPYEELDVYQVEDLGNDMLSLRPNVARNNPLKMSARDIIFHTAISIFVGLRDHVDRSPRHDLLPLPQSWNHDQVDPRD